MHLKSINHDQARAGSIFVEAPARLHLGFVDMHGGLGRRYGSLGLTLESLSTQLTVTPTTIRSRGHGRQRAEHYARRLLDHLGIEASVDIQVHASIPVHAGLGSGTQLSLAVGTAISELFGVGLELPQLCTLMERGRRSGIGIGAFTSGGFLVDGGRRDERVPPPVIARTDFPSAWRVLLILDHRSRGLSGQPERQAFRDLPEFPASRAAELCRLTLMQIMPALAEMDFDNFATGIGGLQRIVGDHFAHAQGGRYTSAQVSNALEWLHGLGVTGIGQSSWGPTGFAFFASAAEAREKAAALRNRFHGTAGLEFRVVQARNHGRRMIAAPVADVAKQILNADRKLA